MKENFEFETIGTIPNGWSATQTGSGKGSEWLIKEDTTSPHGPKILAQTAASPGSMFNLCLAPCDPVQDLEISVSFKAVRGENDQGGGVVWRCQDANHYYIARFNPLEENYRLYRVVDGKRVQLATREGLKIPANEWHTLGVRMEGDRILCSLNGRKYLEAQDSALVHAGKVGLWTKADAQTWFDGFRVDNLSPK